MKIKYAEYIWSVFRQVYQVPDRVSIGYGKKTRKGVYIHNRADNFFDGAETVNATEVVWKHWKGVPLPFLFDKSGERDFFEDSDGHLTINYDLIASSFYLLSGWHEFASGERDSYGRFPYRASIQNKLNITGLPVVNYYFDILKEAIEYHYGITLPFQSNGTHTFYLAVTHDIDLLHSGWLEETYTALKENRWNAVLNILTDKFRGRDIWNNLDVLLEFEREHNITASYYFLPSRQTSNGIPHADYSMSDKDVSQYISAITGNGSEIGIHAPFGSHLKSKTLKHFIQAFNLEVSGGRFHYLGYEPRKTSEVLEQVGLSYDSTLGFAEHIGFRNSFAHPFCLFDLKNNCKTSVLEIPLVIMDQTLAQKKYMGLPPEEAFLHILPLLEEVKKFNGGVAILWHNIFFSEIKFRGWKKVLSDIISYGKQHNAGIGPSRNLSENIKKNYR